MFNDILNIQSQYESYLRMKAEYSELCKQYPDPHNGSCPKQTQIKMRKLSDDIIMFENQAYKYLPILLSWIANHQ